MISNSGDTGTSLVPLPGRSCRNPSKPFTSCMTARTAQSPKTARAERNIHTSEGGGGSGCEEGGCGKKMSRSKNPSEGHHTGPVVAESDADENASSPTGIENAGKGGGSAASNRRERWVCDVCKVQTFDDFDKACRHEESCTGGGPLRQEPAPQPPVKMTKEVYRCDVCKVAQFDDYDEACRHEESCAGLIDDPAPSDAAMETETAAPMKSDEDADISTIESDISPPENTAAAASEPALALEADNSHDDGVTMSSQGDTVKSMAKERSVDLEMAKAKNKRTEGSTTNIQKEATTSAAPMFHKRKQPCRAPKAATRGAGGGGKRTKGSDEAAATAASDEAKENSNTDAKVFASLFTSPRPARAKASGEGHGPSPTTALVQEHKAAEVTAKFAAERRATAQANRERKRKREEAAKARRKDNEKKKTTTKRDGTKMKSWDDVSGGKIDDESDAEEGHTDDEIVVVNDSADNSSSKKTLASVFARPKKHTFPSKSDSSGPATSGVSAGSVEWGKAPFAPSSASLVSKRASGMLNGRPPKYPSAPKFPVPSHTIGVNSDAVGSVRMQTTNGAGGEGEKTSCVATADKIEKGASSLVGAARYQGGGTNLQNCSSALRNAPLLCTDDGLPFCCKDGADELDRAFAAVMSPPPVSIDDEETCEELWSTKYAIQRVPDDVCGDTNRESAASLMKFINEWKAHRADFVKKMEEKRRSLSSRKKKKTKVSRSSHTYYNDEDLWYDSDEDDHGLCKVFLLSGPHGTGKSALVHAAANQAACVLVEINTTEKRGGSALKRAIEECTQSHSSLALLKRGTNPAFSGFGAQTTESSLEVLGDSVDESDRTSRDDEGEEKDVADRGRLAIILIDEVDNIFENDGDAGFWVALANLTKKAMCPIILTSAAAPALLEASSIRYQAACMTRPSALECASRMRHIAKKEEAISSSINGRDDECGKDQLCRIAELCDCDLRNILNEMQLHSHGASSLRQEKRESTDMFPDTSPPFIMHAPKITNISPRFVNANSYNVLTIRGDNFSSSTGLSVTEILIGGRPSPALRTIDNSTILAVCPPCTLPEDVDSSGSFEDTFEPCITCRYASVIVRITMKTGIVLHSDSCTSSGVNAFGRHFNLTFNFPEVEGRLERMSKKRENARNVRQEEGLDALSSDDDDFVIPTARSNETGNAATPRITSTTRGREIANVVSMVSETTEEQLSCSGSDVVDALLESAVNELFPELKSVDEVQREKDAEKKDRDYEKDLLDLEQLAKGVEHASDAALLEDSFSSLAIPTLSGAVRGFGTDFVDSEGLSGKPAAGMASKKLRNSSAKPPSLERVFTSGWNDSAFFFGACESYVTRPTSNRDRRELSKAHAYSNMIHSMRSAIKPDAEDNSKSSSSSSSLTFPLALASSLSNTATNSSNLGIEALSQSIDDSFLQLCVSSPCHSLPSLLRNSATFSSSESLSLLETRRKEKASAASTSASALLEDRGTSNSFCLGLDEITSETPSDLPIGVNHRLSLDYLPSLRAMAAAESEAEIQYAALKARNPDALGLHDKTCRRRATRRSAKTGRTHYFDRIVDGDGMRHEEVNALAKRIGSDLSRTFLSYHGSE